VGWRGVSTTRRGGKRGREVVVVVVAASSAWTLRLLLQEPHLVAAAVRFDRHVVAAAEVLLALVGGRLPQGARQAERLGPVLRLSGKASKLTGNGETGSGKRRWLDRWTSLRYSSVSSCTSVV